MSLLEAGLWWLLAAIILGLLVGPMMRDEPPE